MILDPTVDYIVVLPYFCIIILLYCIAVIRWVKKHNSNILSFLYCYIVALLYFCIIIVLLHCCICTLYYCYSIGKET